MAKKAKDFLADVLTIQAERGKAYDKDDNQEERSMAKIVAIYEMLTGITLSERQGWMFMVVLKMVRAHAKEAFHEDSFTDLISYTSLAAEAGSAEARLEALTAEGVFMSGMAVGKAFPKSVLGKETAPCPACVNPTCPGMTCIKSGFKGFRQPVSNTLFVLDSSL